LLLESWNYEQCNFLFNINDRTLDFSKIKGKTIQLQIKRVYNKLSSPNIADKYGLTHNYCLNTEQSTWKNLWSIKNPILLATRQKVLYKNVYSNERRYRFGLIDSPQCNVCHEVESTIHQLFNCKNARKFWEIYCFIFNIPLQELDFYTLVNVSRDVNNEIIKAIIFKLLIQIDRSANYSPKAAIKVIVKFLSIELNISQNPALYSILECLENF